MKTSEKLLNVAVDLFSKKGWGTVGVQEIVDAAGVTKPTLYHYYGSKRGLLQSILEQHFAPLLHELENLEYHGDVYLTVRELARLLIEFAHNNPVEHRLIVSLSVAAPDSEEHQVIRPFLERRFEAIIRVFRQVSAHHTNIANFESTLTISMIGLTDVHALHANDSDWDQTIEYRVVKQFMYGMWSL